MFDITESGDRKAVPRISKKALLEGITRSIEAGGYRVELRSRPGDHPMRLAIRRGDQEIIVRVYIWALTHGGGPARPSHEQRIQITSGVNRFQVEDGEKTLVLGWSATFGVYAAFDVTRHRARLGSSPSMQIGQNALERAHEVGAAMHVRRRDEIAIAIQPSFLAGYITRMERLHHRATSLQEIEALLDEGPPLPGEVGQAEVEADRVLTNLASGVLPRLGTPDELRQRQEILDRLAALEQRIALGEDHNSRIGHNQPPEPIELEGQENIRSSQQEAQHIAEDLSRTPPEVGRVAQRTKLLSRIARRLQRNSEQAKDKTKTLSGDVRAGLVGVALEKLFSSPYFGWVIDNLIGILGGLAQWFRMLF